MCGAKPVAVAIHEEQLRRHGGQAGYLNEVRLDAALDRPRNTAAYEPDRTLCELAASLALGIAKGHAFFDGNKRSACVASLLFLALNDLELATTEAELGDTFVAVADGSLSEPALARWFADHTATSDTSSC